MATEYDDLVATYLQALTAADVELVLTLFADDAVVHSPLYGPLPAVDFFPRLFSDTGQADLELKSVMHGQDASGRPTLSFWFHFDWRLPSGVPAPFDVVDVATLDEAGRITALWLVYDTVDVRPKFEAETGAPSWRASSAT